MEPRGRGSVYPALCTSVVILSLFLHLSTAKVIDLTHEHGANTFMFPGMPKYNKTTLFKGEFLPGVYADMNAYSVGEHGGTHMDAPSHFTQGGLSIDQIPIEHTILDGVMIDCSEEVKKDNGYMVTLKKLKDWEEKHGRIPNGAAVIINFGWSSKFTNMKLFFGSENVEDPATFMYPYLGLEAADWMASERDVRAIATDTCSPDNTTGNYPVHRRILGDSRMLVENLKGPEQLPARGFRFHYSPVKFVNATGVQVRAYAMTYDEDCMNQGSQISSWSSIIWIGVFSRIIPYNLF